MSSNGDTRKAGSAKATFVVPQEFDAPFPDDVLADWELGPSGSDDPGDDEA